MSRSDEGEKIKSSALVGLAQNWDDCAVGNVRCGEARGGSDVDAGGQVPVHRGGQRRNCAPHVGALRRDHGGTAGLLPLDRPHRHGRPVQVQPLPVSPFPPIPSRISLNFVSAYSHRSTLSSPSSGPSRRSVTITSSPYSISPTVKQFTKKSVLYSISPLAAHALYD